DGYKYKSEGEYRKRIFLPEFEDLDPLRYPWKDWRKTPERFPETHVAKVSSVRTVVGMNFVGKSSSHFIYLKRSFSRTAKKKFIGLFRASKEWREFELATRLLSMGIHTPKPVYYAETEMEGLPTRFLATESFSTDWVEVK